MYKYKIWDKKEPINGIPAHRVIENRPEFEEEAVILIYNEKNPYQIIYVQTEHDRFYQLGDTVDMTAHRYVKFYNEQPDLEVNLNV